MDEQGENDEPAKGNQRESGLLYKKGPSPDKKIHFVLNETGSLLA